VICCICEELKSELHKAQLEILSYGKVIQVLREALYVVLCTQPDSRKQSDYLAEQPRGYKSKDDWTQVTSLNRKAKGSNNHLIQLIPPTHNKYDVLSNLKEDSKTPNPTYKKEESLNTRGNQINTRKIQLVKSAKK